MTNFNFDKAHSSLEFTVKHLMVSRVKGTFEDYNVEVSGDINDFSTLKATVTIKADSINTKNADRDAHLKSADFFSADENPNITFETKSISEDSITGDLTIAGVTHEETFDVDFNGVSKNPLNGETVTGFAVTGKIDREKYGVSFNQALETGGVMIGRDVKFEASAEFGLSE
ncbi:YceI family protein [Mammaliicoccus sciuri]|uniref:YceI family protein n=1 Tax=Mammaliicoccus sciuri TaxID=1296 RepID=UPI000D1E7023|nr:YceI family protein [Mammaliicoccus sciuri]MCD3218875.1 YceI family protein [Mammaliicoccus sciuri]MCD8796473.1 YceI family protein [Mammaliicoccus sciuri]MCD8875140.1 YceI family protein [Mammaliicoccus sciuri]MCY1028547.1 YceI family protein [Mammaliicoccus sciuri]MEB7408091.1 YceI family protein [Mammaliicoccus sciuri]